MLPLKNNSNMEVEFSNTTAFLVKVQTCLQEHGETTSFIATDTVRYIDKDQRQNLGNISIANNP